MAASTTIAALGDELLASVLDYLSPGQLATAEACCKRWRRVCQEHGFWRRHATAAVAELQDRHVPQLPDLNSLGLSWKERYLEYAFLLAATLQYQTNPTAHRVGSRSFARVLTAHERVVTCCATLGRRLVTGSVDKTARIWDLDTLHAAGGTLLQPLHTLHHASAVIYASFLSPDTTLTATEAGGYVWRGGRLVRRLGDGGSQGGPTIKRAAAWDTYLAAGMSDGSIRIYDVYSGSLVKILRPHTREITALVHVSHHQLDVLVSAGNERLAVTDVESGLQLAQAVPPCWALLGGHNGQWTFWLESVVVNPSQGYLLAYVNALSLVRWDCGLNLSLLPTPLQRVGMAQPKMLPAVGCRSAHGRQLALPTFGSTSCVLAGNAQGGLEAYRVQDLESWPVPLANPAARLPGLHMSPFPLASLHSSCASSLGPAAAAAASAVGWSRVLAASQQEHGGSDTVWMLQPSVRQPAPSAVNGLSREASGLDESLANAAAVGVPAPKSGMPSGGARVPTSTLAGRTSGPLGSYIDSCTCICAAQVPFVTGHRNGQVVLWWRSRSATVPAPPPKHGPGMSQGTLY